MSEKDPLTWLAERYLGEKPDFESLTVVMSQGSAFCDGDMEHSKVPALLVQFDLTRKSGTAFTLEGCEIVRVAKLPQGRFLLTAAAVAKEGTEEHRKALQFFCETTLGILK